MKRIKLTVTTLSIIMLLSTTVLAGNIGARTTEASLTGNIGARTQELSNPGNIGANTEIAPELDLTNAIMGNIGAFISLINTLIP